MKEVVYFASTTYPAQIDIRRFFAKVIAFDYCPNHDDYNYFYDGDPENAKEYLQSIGFKNVRILKQVPWEKMKG